MINIFHNKKSKIYFIICVFSFVALYVKLFPPLHESSLELKKQTIVSTFSILSDLLRTVTQDLPFEIHTLVPYNADPHIYQPTPLDAKRLSKAQVVVVNGLGFECWVDRLIQASGFSKELIVAAKHVKARPDILDPHAWHSIPNLKLYVQEIRDRLCFCYPQYADKLCQNSLDLLRSLEELDIWIRHEFQDIPRSHRIVITTHDAFWYFGQAYGVTFLSPVGISTEIEPSAYAVAQLIRMIRSYQTKAIFLENLTSRIIIENIARETGLIVSGTLYADSLKNEQTTVIDMIRDNVTSMKKALLRN